MKKLSFMLLSLLAVTMLTACGNEDEPDNKQTLTSIINTRAIVGDDVVFSQGSAKVELDYTNMLISFTADYKDADGQSHSLSTPSMKLISEGGAIYTFNATSGQGVGSVLSLEGTIDMNTGMLWFRFLSGSTEYVSTSQLLYAYTTTNITNPDNGNHGSHKQSGYLFALDARGETCIMKIFNFVSTLNGAIDAVEVQYQDLTVTPTATGYRITAPEVESSIKGFYALTNVDITLDDQCNVIAGSFKSNGLEFEFSGNVFNRE